MNEINSVLLVCATLLVSTPVIYWLTRTKFERGIRSNSDRAILEAEYSRGKVDGVREMQEKNQLLDSAKSDGLKATIELEYLRGKVDGAREELEKFQITYIPVVEEEDSLFSHKFDAGYEMQLSYAGLPVGDPTRRITSHKEKFKDENVNKAIDLVTKLLESRTGQFKIPATVVRDAIRDKK